MSDRFEQLPQTAGAGGTETVPGLGRKFVGERFHICSGRVPRMGEAPDVVEDPGFTDHFAIATSPELLAFLSSLQGGGLSALEQATGPLKTGAAIVRQGAGLVLTPLAAGP